jgi:hypothetical protein
MKASYRMLRLMMTIALLVPTAMGAADIYAKVVVDPGGQLQITTKDGRTISLKKESEQVGYGDPVISEDGQAVGWTGLYKYGTSYPVPWDLVVYSAGKMHHFGHGGGMPIAGWRFEARGKQVAFRTETLHGPEKEYYELSDVTTGRMIARFDPADNPDKPLPKWAEGLNDQK